MPFKKLNRPFYCLADWNRKIIANFVFYELYEHF